MQIAKYLSFPGKSQVFIPADASDRKYSQYLQNEDKRDLYGNSQKYHIELSHK